MPYCGKRDAASTSETNIPTYKSHLCICKPHLNTLKSQLQQVHEVQAFPFTIMVQSSNDLTMSK